MIGLGDNVIEIELEGLAALQEISLLELPPDRDKARIAIGDAVNRTMAKVLLAPAVQYVSEYMIECGIMRHHASLVSELILTGDLSGLTFSQ